MCQDFVVLAQTIIEDFGRTALICKFLELFNKVVHPTQLDISEGFGELDGVLMYFAETGDGNKVFDYDTDNTMRYLVLKARIGELPFQFWSQYFLTSALLHSHNHNIHNDLQISAFYSELEGLTNKSAALSELKEISQLELVEVTTMVIHFCYVCGVSDQSVFDNITNRLKLSRSADQLEEWLTARAYREISEYNLLEEESKSLGDELLASSTRRFESFKNISELVVRARLALTNEK